MIGPRTLDGGYSPSQYISSAMFTEKESALRPAKDGRWDEAWGATNPETAATTKEQIKKVSFAIFLI